MLAVLPFQTDADRFLVAIYLMSFDYTQPTPELPYRITFSGLPGTFDAGPAYAPLSGRWAPTRCTDRGLGELTIEMSVADCPQLVELSRTK